MAATAALIHLLAVGLSMPQGTIQLATARSLLSAYDQGHRRAAAEGGEGMGGAISANKWAASADREALAAAMQTVSSHAERVMLGFCADDVDSGVRALKSWVGALSLPRGRLHGMDADGVPLDMSTFGSCYIKYNSLPTAGDPPGSALLSGYDGDFRGVYFSPDLGEDFEFAQYGVLPLDVFGADARADGSARSVAPGSAKASTPADGPGPSSAPAAPSPSTRGPRALHAKLAEEAVAELLPDVHAAGGSLRLLDATPEGGVTLAFHGPARLQTGVEVALRASKLAKITEVVFVDAAADGA